MKKLLTSVALAGCIIASGSVIANGMGEDGSWQFKTPNENFYLLEVERQRQLLDDGGYDMHTTVNEYGDKYYDIEYDIETQNNNSNCINCSEVNVDGNGNIIGVDQDATDSNQSNSHISVGDDLKVKAKAHFDIDLHGGKKGGHKPPMYPDQDEG